MYGQMTAGSWIYIGTQGILQGTYETFGALAKIKGWGSLKGKFCLTAGLGGMGGAQPLAITMNEGVGLIVEVDPAHAKRRLDIGYVDRVVDTLEEAMTLVDEYKDQEKPQSIGLIGNAADITQELAMRGVIPDVVTDQTSAHEALMYVPSGLSVAAADELRKSNPEEYKKRAMASMAQHVQAMLEFQHKGAEVFDYGNNLRQQAYNDGVTDAFEFPGFVPAYIRPLFCEGKGPFRWVALSGDPEDIYRTDEAVAELFPQDDHLQRWLKLARAEGALPGAAGAHLLAGLRGTPQSGSQIQRDGGRRTLKAPIVIGRDHLDCGSVASPNRETEAMKDGSDAISDWAILNAMINAVGGATWVSFHHGGGVGIGYSQHAGQVIVADGTPAAAKRLERVLTTDPGLGVVRHADAGYEQAIAAAKRHGIQMPMLK